MGFVDHTAVVEVVFLNKRAHIVIPEELAAEIDALVASAVVASFLLKQPERNCSGFECSRPWIKQVVPGKTRITRN